VISAALAQGAGAQEKIRLAQSSTVTNCMMNGKLPNHLCRGHAASRFYRLYQQRSNAHSKRTGHHPVLVEL